MRHAGYGVSDKIEKSVSDITEPNCWSCGYCHSEMGVYSVGMLGALISAALFLLTATFFKMPVSTTHAIVGGVIGMTVTQVGPDCIDWWYSGLGGIVTSWLISPLLSGLIGAGIYIFTNTIIFKSNEKWNHAFRMVPIFYSLVTWVMVFMLTEKSNTMKVHIITSCVCFHLWWTVASVP
jgi:solute carrier family 20 (sodium-dependent phosphate transporter)